MRIKEQPRTDRYATQRDFAPQYLFVIIHTHPKKIMVTSNDASKQRIAMFVLWTLIRTDFSLNAERISGFLPVFEPSRVAHKNPAGFS